MSKHMTKPANQCRRRLAVSMAIIALISAFGLTVFAQQTNQEKFKSPEDAMRALIEAANTNNTVELLAIFGPEGKSIISSGDAVADSNARKRFVAAAEEALKFLSLDDKTVLAVIGKDACSFPVPIVKSGQEWVFSTDDGKQEIINRRIGKNELSTIEVSLAYVDAQREYASKDRDGSGVLQYAQRFRSHEGRKDGLYWEAAAGQESSPLGPLMARATEEGYSARKPGEKPRPYHGYYFKILQSQGSKAPGGERDYIINGKMTAGFGLLAYPAQYGVSGIMTFTVNQKGIVYEKDLGPKTKEVVDALIKYDPDETWKTVK
jgi:Tfp pilus assembly protein FimT